MIDSTTPLYPETIPVPKIERTHQKRPRSISTLMESGRMRLRRSYDTEVHYIQATWHFTEDEFDRFKMWFEETLINGEVAFSMETYDESVNAGEVEEITWELLFAEGNYSFSHSDNLYQVLALLEVVSFSQQSIPDPHSPLPPIEIWYDEEGNTNPDVCRHSILFNTSGLADDPFNQQGYILQIAESASGPWYDHVFIREARESVKLNNDYPDRPWFKIINAFSGSNVTKAVNPLGPAIQPPAISISDLVFSEHGLRADGPFPYAYSALENPLISNSDLYIVPRLRYEYYQPTLAWDNVPQIVSISGNSESVHKWTRDRRDPSIQTTMPVLGGYANNLAAYQTDFGHMIKARSFHPNGCKSPMTCHLVDQHIYHTPRNEVSGVGAAMAGVCDQPRTDMVREDWTRDPETGEFTAPLVSHEFESGNSCNNYSPNLAGFLAAITKGAATASKPPIQNLVFLRTNTATSGGEILDMGTGDAGDQRVGFIWNKAFVTVWALSLGWTVIRDGNWNASPIAFSNLNLSLSGTGDYYLNGGTSWTGPSGTGNTLATLAFNVAQPIAAEKFSGNSFETVTFEFFILLTAHDDFFSFIDPGYIVPVVPPIEEPYIPSVFIGGDDFEDSVISSPPYQGGTGWKTASAWIVKTIPSYTGYDDFQAIDIEDANDGGVLNTGNGWAEDSEWTRKTSFSETGGHDFQTSELGPVHPALGPEGGTKWDDVWSITSAKDGGDNFQSYTTGVVFNDTTKELVPLNGGTGMGGFWVVKADT